MPEARVSFRGGTGVSIALHGLLVLIILWTGIAAANRLAGTGPGSGPAGGGGGTGSVTYVEIPAFIGQTQGVRAPDPEVDGVEFQMLRTEVKEIARPLQKERFSQAMARVAPAVWRGRGGGSERSTGAGPGSGGGVGSGQGSNAGPGTGGGGGAVLAPERRAVIYPVTEPPSSVSGVQLLIHFWVDARGKVTKVLIEPDLAENTYTRELRESLYQWIFYPARTAEGRATEGELVVPYVP